MRASFPGSRGRVRLVAAALLATVVCVALAACSVAAAFPACCGTESCGTSGTERNGLICCCSTGSIGLTWNYPSSSPTCATQPPPCASAPTPPGPDPTPTPSAPAGPICFHVLQGQQWDDRTALVLTCNILNPPASVLSFSAKANRYPYGDDKMFLAIVAPPGYLPGWQAIVCQWFDLPNCRFGESDYNVNSFAPKVNLPIALDASSTGIWTFKIQCYAAWPGHCTADIDIRIQDGTAPSPVPVVASSSTGGPWNPQSSSTGAGGSGSESRSSTAAEAAGGASGGSTDSNSKTDDGAAASSLELATIVGIVAGCVGAAALILGGIWLYLYIQRKKLQQTATQLNLAQSTTSRSLQAASLAGSASTDADGINIGLSEA